MGRAFHASKLCKAAISGHPWIWTIEWRLPKDMSKYHWCGQGRVSEMRAGAIGLEHTGRQHILTPRDERINPPIVSGLPPRIHLLHLRHQHECRAYFAKIAKGFARNPSLLLLASKCRARASTHSCLSVNQRL